MKRLILLCLPIFLLFACGQEMAEQEVSKTVTLSGKIENPKGEQVALKGANEFSESASVQEDGTFTMSFDIEEPGNYSFRHGGERTTIYIEPGNNMNVTLNTEQFDETLQYKGDGAAENNYLAGIYLKNEALLNDYQAIYSLETSAFDEKMKTAYSEMNEFLTGYLKDNPDLEVDFAALQKTNLKYEEMEARLKYPNYYEYFTKNEPEIGEDYYAFLNQADLNKEALLESSKYKSFLRFYLSGHLSEAEMEKDESLEDAPNGRTIADFRAIDANFKNATIKDYLLENSMSSAISYGSLDGIEDLIADFKKRSSSEEDKKAIEEQYAKWAKLTKGNPAPVFAYNNINGEKVSLEDLRGKYVYVDVWATWCGPCKREQPHLEEIEAAYKDNENIAFVGVSIDENKEAWEKMVTEKNMAGIHLIADKAWDSKITKDYLIGGIPRFLLIDKEGKIVDARAARPSSDAIKTQLKELVGEGSYKATSMNF